MPLTRVQRREQANRLLTEVMDFDDDAGLVLALRDMFGKQFNVGDMLFMSEDALDELVYQNPRAGEDGEPDTLSVGIGHKNYIKILQHFNRYRHKIGKPIPPDEWDSVTAAEFQAFRFSDYLQQITLGGRNDKVGSPNSSNGTSTKSPAELFVQGIRKDPSAYPTLHKDTLYDNWIREFSAVGSAHGLDSLFDNSYVPADDKEEELFEKQQKFLFSVLCAKLKTSTGQDLVRNHTAKRDAQAILAELADYHHNSTKAGINSGDLLTYITSAKLGPGSTWNGTTEDFILNWVNKTRLYDANLTDPLMKLHEDLKKTMLENAVQPIPFLANVKQQEAQLKVAGNPPLGFNGYLKLLISAAQSYDNQKKSPGLGAARRRQVLEHDVVGYGEHFGYAEPYASPPEPRHVQVHDIDTDVGTLLQPDPDPYDDRESYSAFATSHGVMRPGRNHPRSSRDGLVRMSGEQWGKLDANARSIWDKLDQASKAIILGRDPSKGSRQVNIHEMRDALTMVEYLAATHNVTSTEQDDDPAPPTEGPTEESSNLLVNAMKTGKSLHPGDLRKMMSASKSTRFNPKDRNVNVCYRVTQSSREKDVGSLVDRGANGGVAGDDVRIIHRHGDHQMVDIEGIDKHRMTGIPLCTVGGVTKTDCGDVILIMHQYAYTGKGHTIHSSAQIEAFKNTVDDKSKKANGNQRIVIKHDSKDYVLPLDIVRGLVRLKLRPYTDTEFKELPHVVLTSDATWDPTTLDYSWGDDDPEWHATVPDKKSPSKFDSTGNYLHRSEDYPTWLSNLTSLTDDKDLKVNTYDLFASDSKPSAIDYEKYRSRMLWLPLDIVKKTFAKTTQYARAPAGVRLKQFFKSPFPALNHPRRDEDVATDTVYSDTPAIDNGAKMAQLFTGISSTVTDVYAMKNDNQFVNTLEDNIRERGAMRRLISDRASVEISQRVDDILRAMFIGSWQSEPKHQHQNPAERRINTIKDATNRLMDRVGAPDFTWYLALSYVCYVYNHTWNETIGHIPLALATGQPVDISNLLRFTFWERVLYRDGDEDFPSDSREESGRFVGIATNVGHVMTYLILTDTTQKVVPRSRVRPFSENDPNLRVEPIGGEKRAVIKNRSRPPPLPPEPPWDSTATDQQNTQGSNGDENGGNESEPTKDDQNGSGPHTFSPDDLIGRSFLLPQEEDGTRLRVRIAEKLIDEEARLEQNPTRLKFRCTTNDDAFEEILTFAEIVEHIEREENNTDVLWKFKRIAAHEGPLRPDHHNYKGSKYNVRIEWENGEITSEPLNIIAADDPITCAIYAKDNNLLELDGWKRFKRLAKRAKKFLRCINQAKLRSYNTAPKYKYGFEVPRNYEHAKEIDRQNGNTRWQDAVDLEMRQLDEYETFKDNGKTWPDGYQRLRIHLVFDVKHDGRHKARMVAEGHRTDVPLESVYSGVVSIRSIRLVAFLAEHNGLELWATDIGNAYLESKTKERLAIVAGPEFGPEREGHVLIVYKALYGLRTSGKRWFECLAACLTKLGFKQCIAEPSVWMRKSKDGTSYEYIATYVDDLLIAMKNPQEIIDALKDKKTFNFKLKGTGPVSFHLGVTYARDSDGVLYMSPKRFLEKIFDEYEQHFGEKPKEYSSPILGGSHPELDTSELLDSTGIQQYQSIVGSLQWAVTIGRSDIAPAVMTLSSFRAAPRKGHLECAKRVVGYLSKMRHAAVRIRVGRPDFSEIPIPAHDWMESIYGKVEEVIPENAPEPLGPTVVLTTYVDANLYHDMLTGRALTGIYHFVNQTPVDWFCKKQGTVETATYGSEFVAARIATDQIIDLRNTLRYLGVRIEDHSVLFGDNKSVVDSSMIPHHKLNKRHNALSFHRVREAVASGMLRFFHIDGKVNPADVLSKHWDYSAVWKHLQPLLFWQGDTIELEDKE